MNDPFNQLPTDPEWLRKAHALGEQAALELQCMVLLVAVQENGKISVSLEGAPETGDLAEILKECGAPGVLLYLARVMFLMEQRDQMLGARQ